MSSIYHTYYRWTNKDNKWNATILCFFLKKVADNISLAVYFKSIFLKMGKKMFVAK